MRLGGFTAIHDGDVGAQPSSGVRRDREDRMIIDTEFAELDGEPSRAAA